VRKLRHAREAANAPRLAASSPDVQWLKQYGRHLGRLYEPVSTLPPDLDRLVRAIAAEAAQHDDWPDIF
jgi:hypothetical protein